jgi:hypothetical protein
MEKLMGVEEISTGHDTLAGYLQWFLYMID